MRTHRNQDFGRIQNDLHGLYYAAEIPYRYWDHDPGKPEFVTALWGERKKIKAEVQQAWWDKFSKGKYVRTPKLLIACANPSDELALAQVFEVCKRFIRAAAQKAVPLGLSVEEASDEPRKDAYQDSCPMFVLTNVLASPPSRPRTVGVRDWIVRHKDTCRIVVVAGTPYTFHETYGVEPDAVFQFSGVTRFVRSFG